MMMRTNDSGKRALCLGLASVIMMLACFVLGTGPAEAETDGFTYEVMEDGTAAITACSLTGDIEIPSTIDGYTVTKLGQKLFYGSFGVTSVSVPATVTQLGNNENLQFAYVFSYCYSLEKITVDPENTVLVSVDGVLYTKDMSLLINYPCAKAGESYRVSGRTKILDCTSFAAAQNLTSLYLDGSDTLWKTYTFYADPDLTVYYQPGGQTEEEVNYLSQQEDREFFPAYVAVGSETGDDKTALADKVREVIAEVITESMTDREKAVALHNWIVTHAYYSFDYSSPNGVMIHGTGLCESYARAYKLLLDEAGISSALIEGTTVNSKGITEAHMWNKVMIDGTWYHVDCTWDDPSDSSGSTEAISGNETTTYLLVTDEMISRDHFWEGSENVHTHVVEKAEKVDSTCTDTGTEEYWFCSVCGKLFSDENGSVEISAPIIIERKPHTEVVDEAVPATETSTGLTEGSHCEVCGEILVAQEVTPILEPAHVQTGWVQNDGVWYLYDDGTLVTGWHFADGSWYWFNDSGAMATGWIKDGNDWYYMSSGGAMQTGWVQDNGNWYYFTGGGSMYTGWLQSGNTWYFLKSSGIMATGWQQIGGVWYWFSESGEMAAGWQQIGSTWYWFSAGGEMATGWQKIGGTWYLFSADGAMATGWQKADGEWYYFKKSGAMASNEWIEDREAEKKLPANEKRTLWYWFDVNGHMAKGWKEINGKWEMFSDSGEWLYTWQAN